MSMRAGVFLLMPWICLMAGCAVQPPDSQAGLQALLQPHLVGVDTGLVFQSAVPDEAVTGGPLTMEASVRLALQHNQVLRAQLAALGVAQADVSQAALLSNPVLAIGALSPEGGGRWQLDLGLSQSLLDLLTRGLRQQLAKAEYARIQHAVSEVMFMALQDIRSAYLEAVTAQHKARVADELTQTAANAASLSVAYHEAGNIPEREQLELRVKAAEWRNRSDQLASEAAIAVSRLADQIGLPVATSLSVLAELPAYSRQKMDCAALQQAALSARFDLQQRRLAEEQQAHALSLAQKSYGMTELDIGIDSEREYDGNDHAGPSVSLSVPVFDQGQAQVAKQRALLQQAEAERKALANRIPHEVQQACWRHEAALQQAERFRTIVVPHQERLVTLALQEYNYMLVGAGTVLQAKQDALAAQLDFIEASAAVWQAEVGLAKVVGSDVAAVQARPEGDKP